MKAMHGASQKDQKRHPDTEPLLRWFDNEHLPPGRARAMSGLLGAMATQVANALTDGPELSAGLRKLLEAKDCFVRQAIADEEKDNE